MVSDQPDFVRQVWLGVRPDVLAKADRVLAAVQQWTAEPDDATWQTIVSTTHQLAGSIGSFGFDAAQAAAQDLDSAVRSDPVDPLLLVALARRLRDELERT